MAPSPCSRGRPGRRRLQRPAHLGRRRRRSSPATTTRRCPTARSTPSRRPTGPSRSRSGTAAWAARPRPPWRSMVAASTPASRTWCSPPATRARPTPRCTASSPSAASAGTDQLPDIIYLEDTQLQAMADSGLVLPAQACMEADGLRPDRASSPRSGRSTRSDDVLYPGYMNVSTPVLYYNKAHFAQAGLDPDEPARHARGDVRGGQDAQGSRGQRQAVLVQGQPLVLRDVADRHRRRDRQQRQRPQRPGHRGHLRHARGRGPDGVPAAG